MARKRSTDRNVCATRAGFTLVELLVAVGLVMLIMLMFAEVFRSATGMISTQKGIAENDSRERTIQTALLYDLKKRTFVEMIPFQNGHDTRLLDSLAARQGYFYISENDPNNNTDDVIAFTIRSSNVVSGLDNDTPYFGRATSLQNWAITGLSTSGGAGADTITVGVDLTGYLEAGGKIAVVGSVGNPATGPNLNGVYTIQTASFSSNTTITVAEDLSGVTLSSNGRLYLSRSNGNEPEFDDGVFAINNAGVSNAAEVCYFLRHGNLYRRQLLIRDPHEPANNPSIAENETGADLVGNFGPAFWGAFDYSAYRINGEDVNENGSLDTGGAIPGYDEDDGPGGLFPPDDGDGNLDNPVVVRFHTVSDLSNAGTGVATSLGLPVFRFGHSPSLGGLPREFLDSGEFIGRFTQQETADDFFFYPGCNLPYDSTAAALNPMRRTGLTLNPATGAVNTAGVNTAYEGIDRRGEDIIATNVHEFDVKVFSANFGADGAPGVAGTDDDGDGLIDWLNPPTNTLPDLEEVGVAGCDDIVGFHDLGRGGNGMYTATSNGTYGNRFDTWNVNAGATAPYRMVSNGTDLRAGMANWPDDGNQLRPGFTDWELGPDGSPGNSGDDDGDTIDVDYGADTVPGSVGDDDGNGVAEDAVEIGWVGSDDIVDFDELGFPGSDDVPDRHELGFIGTDDEVPLRAIQIRIRFVDASSNQMRQMTLVYALDELE